MGSYFAGSDRSTVVPAQPSTWRLRTVGPAQISLASEDFSFSSRWAGLIPAIGRFDPDVVLFVGLSSPLVWSLQRDYPVVGMSLHTVAPLAPVDVWLAADPQTGKAMFWPDLPAPQITFRSGSGRRSRGPLHRARRWASRKKQYCWQTADTSCMPKCPTTGKPPCSPSWRHSRRCTGC